VIKALDEESVRGICRICFTYGNPRCDGCSVLRAWECQKQERRITQAELEERLMIMNYASNELA
jgi:hypothetical protein